MKRLIVTGYICLLSSIVLFGQDNYRPDGTDVKSTQPVIEKKISTLKLSHDYIKLDSIRPDTLLDGFQQRNPIYRKSPFQIYLGNMGLAAQSQSLMDKYVSDDFVFGRNFSDFIEQPNQFLYYNTTVPYTNLTYHSGAPKRRSEEFLYVLFTQNVNKKLNFGIDYKLYSSIGRYNAQRSDIALFRFFSSYQGDNYSLQSSIAINKIDQYENGGIKDIQSILNPSKSALDNPENIDVNFTKAKNNIKNVQFFLNQSLGIGHLSTDDSTASSSSGAIGTAFHQLHIQSSKRVYSISDLAEQLSAQTDTVYANYYIDKTSTNDSARLTTIKSTFQLMLNEEANKWLKFGLRAYIENEVLLYRTPINSASSDITLSPLYRHNNTTFVTSLVGGEIFKNAGEFLTYRAGLKLYFQGYRVGDSELTGALNSVFRVSKDTASVFAYGGVYLQQPTFWSNNYFSNHIQWENKFNKQKALKVGGGFTIPTKRFELKGELQLINDAFYWNTQALPDQAIGVLNVFELQMKEHFKWGGLNSIHQIAYQETSDNDIMPLPQLAYYTSNYFEHVAFKVLQFQIGFDTRIHSKYYAPAYFAPTAQFVAQNSYLVGEYPYIDVFINLHLKRARLGFKMENINKGWPNSNYFIVPGYPANSRGFKFDLSWNFYN